MTQSSILCQYTFLGEGHGILPSCGNTGCTLSVFFFWREDGPLPFLVVPHDLVVPPQLFFGITPFPRRKEGHGILPSFWFDPHDWSSRPQVCFLTITLTYLRRGTTFSRLAVPSFCPPIYSQNYTPREAVQSAADRSQESVRLQALAVPPHQWLK